MSTKSSSQTRAPSSSSETATSSVINTSNDDAEGNVITISEKIKLTKNRYEVLNIICNTYQKPISEYMQQALVQAMESDIEVGDFCDTLLSKLDEDDNDNESKDNNSLSSNTTKLNDNGIGIRAKGKI